MLVHAAVARLRGTVRVKCLDQEHNTMSCPGIKPGLLDLGTSAPRPSHLPLLTKLMTTITFLLKRLKDTIRGFSHETLVVITTNIKIQ